jgi:hypothetical protein
VTDIDKLLSDAIDASTAGTTARRLGRRRVRPPRCQIGEHAASGGRRLRVRCCSCCGARAVVPRLRVQRVRQRAQQREARGDGIDVVGVAQVDREALEADGGPRERHGATAQRAAARRNALDVCSVAAHGARQLGAALGAEAILGHVERHEARRRLRQRRERAARQRAEAAAAHRQMHRRAVGRRSERRAQQLAAGVAQRVAVQVHRRQRRARNQERGDGVGVGGVQRRAREVEKLQRKRGRRQCGAQAVHQLLLHEQRIGVERHVGEPPLFKVRREAAVPRLPVQQRQCLVQRDNVVGLRVAFLDGRRRKLRHGLQLVARALQLALQRRQSPLGVCLVGHEALGALARLAHLAAHVRHRLRRLLDAVLVLPARFSALADRLELAMPLLLVELLRQLARERLQRVGAHAVRLGLVRDKRQLGQIRLDLVELKRVACGALQVALQRRASQQQRLIGEFELLQLQPKRHPIVVVFRHRGRRRFGQRRHRNRSHSCGCRTGAGP